MIVLDPSNLNAKNTKYMNEQNANQSTGQQGSPRMPDIDPQMFALLTELDTFIGKAPLSRGEHAQVNNGMQTLLRRLESDKNTMAGMAARIQSLEEELARIRNATAASEAVNDALSKGTQASLPKKA